MLWLSANETLQNIKFIKNRSFNLINLDINFINKFIYDYKNGKKKTLKPILDLGSYNLKN